MPASSIGYKQGLYRRCGKRVLDLALTVPALILLAPVLAVLTLLGRVKLGAPVWFRQRRPGLHGKPFTLLKFRTMSNAQDAEGNLLPDAGDPEGNVLPDAERLTTFGRFLRSLSLDELPELWNVARGDMSLVGPRPLLMQYLDRYTPEQARRHDVRPGITGLAQVDGRNDVSWDERFRLDVSYVDTLSFALDIKILCRTIWTVVARKGISAAGCATMAEFMGKDRGPDGMTLTEAMSPSALREE